MRQASVAAGIGVSLLLVSCGGGNGAQSTDPQPQASLSASPTTVGSGGAATLSWSSTNATACTASGGWSGALAASGSKSSGAIAANTTFALTCTGPGGTSNTATAVVTVANDTVTVSPAIAAITLWQTQQFTVSVPGGGGATWSVDGVAGGNATVGGISVNGLYTPGTVAGVHTIAAASVANTAQSGSAVAAVTDLAGVYTYHNDLARDGANTREYALTAATVNGGGFGKLYSCTVDGAVYSQPLWVANLAVNGAKHNAVFVATQHDSLYAFDADANPCVTLWSVSLIDTAHGANAGETTVPAGPTGNLVGSGFGDVTPEVGVTGTPVIDPSSGTLYVVSKSVNSTQNAFYQRLHAIDLATGGEKNGSPVTITGTYPGSGDGGTTVSFDARQENQRPGLALLNGVVYVAWSAHEDTYPWYGWVMGYHYDGASFTQTAVLNVTPNAHAGGIWMSGGAPAADSNNNIYLLTGNGAFDATNGTAPNDDYGDSLLKLTTALTVLQNFTPSDHLTLDQTDGDFGAGGTAVLADLPGGNPVTHLLIGGGKDGSLYLLNRDSLGGLGDSAAVQKIGIGYPIFATGAYWNDLYFLAGASGPLTEYLLNPSVPQINVVASSAHRYAFPGSTPSISAAGTQNGIVWALDDSQYCTSQSPGCGPAVLYAYDAGNMTTELWNSADAAADAAGYAVKFTVPTIVNGKVYVGTRGNNVGGAYGSSSVSGELDVYGLRP